MFEGIQDNTKILIADNCWWELFLLIVKLYINESLNVKLFLLKNARNIQMNQWLRIQI